MTSEAKLAYIIKTKLILCQPVIPSGSGKPERRMNRESSATSTKSPAIVVELLIYRVNTSRLQMLICCTNNLIATVMKIKIKLKIFIILLLQVYFENIFQVKCTFYVVLCHKYNVVFEFFSPLKSY